MRRPYGSLMKPLYYWEQGDIFQGKLQNMKMNTEKDKSFAIQKEFLIENFDQFCLTLLRPPLSYHLSKAYKICLLCWLLNYFPQVRSRRRKTKDLQRVTRTPKKGECPVAKSYFCLNNSISLFTLTFKFRYSRCRNSLLNQRHGKHLLEDF